MGSLTFRRHPAIIFKRFTVFLNFYTENINKNSTTAIVQRNSLEFTWIPLIWIVRVFWLVYKCVFIALWSTKMTWAIWLAVSELWEFTLFTSYIIFLFVNTENNSFIKEIKHVVHVFITCWKPRKSLWEFSKRWKPSTASWVFTDLLSNSPKCTPRFSPGYESTQNVFYFLNKTFYWWY